jgi:hypothetical protein
MNQKGIFNKKLLLMLSLEMILMLKTDFAFVEEKKQLVSNELVWSQQIIEPMGDIAASIFEYADKFFLNSMVLIIPDKMGNVYLTKTTDFSSDSTKFLNQNRPIKLNKLSSVLLEETKGDINKAYYLLIIAQEDIPYKYILEVVNVYQESFNEVSNQDFDLTKFHLILFYSFKKFDELKGWGNSEGK